MHDDSPVLWTSASHSYDGSREAWLGARWQRGTLSAELLDQAKKARAGDGAAGRYVVTAFQLQEAGSPRALEIAFGRLIHHFVRRGGRLLRNNYEDAYQEGLSGLFEGATRLDLSREGKPANYLGTYIKGHVYRYQSQCVEAVRTPHHLWQTKQHPVNGSVRVFSEMRVRRRRNSEETLEYEDTLVDGHALAEEQLGDYELDQGMAPFIEWMFTKLTPIEASILRFRFWEDKTLAEIGDKYNLSRERIRQLQESAFLKCRRVCESIGAEPGDAYSEWVSDAYHGFKRRADLPPAVAHVPDEFERVKEQRLRALKARARTLLMAKKNNIDLCDRFLDRKDLIGIKSGFGQWVYAGPYAARVLPRQRLNPDLMDGACVVTLRLGRNDTEETWAFTRVTRKQLDWTETFRSLLDKFCPGWQQMNSALPAFERLWEKRASLGYPEWEKLTEARASVHR